MSVQTELPPLPAGSRIDVTEDEHAQPCLRWRVQTDDGLPRLLQIIVLVTFFVAAIAVPRYCMGSVFRESFSWKLLVGWGAMSIVWGITLVLVSIRLAAWLEPGRNHAQLILKEYWLQVDLGRRTRVVEHVRPFIRGVRLDYSDDVERLLIEFGDHKTVEFGAELNSADRAWLADVLGEWLKSTAVLTTLPADHPQAERVTAATDLRLPPPRFQLPLEEGREQQPEGEERQPEE